MSEDCLSISELNQFIKDVLNAGFPQRLWISGEIQGYNRNASKRHIFFELVEKDPDSKDIIARIGVVIFANSKMRIDQILQRSENAFSLKDDIEVKFACTVDFYPPHGAVRLIIEDIDPAYTLGRLAQEKQKLIALLKKKGVFEKNKVHTLAEVPLNIGLITSDDSAAYNDFRSELEKSGFAFSLKLRNTLMQGQKSESDVCKALAELQKIKDLDIIVITRGGGSIADLSCFDSQKIAEAIAAARLPVLSGIGHEIDLTITDMAAHTSAKTPTAIAQFIVGRVEEFLNTLDEHMLTIAELARDKIEEKQRALKDIALGLSSHTQQFLKAHTEHMIQLGEYFRTQPLNQIVARKTLINTHKSALAKAAKVAVNSSKDRLKGYAQVIDIVHPRNTMKRGFSVLRNKAGKAVRSVKDIGQGEPLKTEVTDGVIESVSV